MRIGNPKDLDKCIREERYLRVSCVLFGLVLFAVGADWLYTAMEKAADLITMNISRETSLVFDLVFAAIVAVGYFSAGVSLFVRATMSGPNQKAIRILSERITELDSKIEELSKPTVAGDSESRTEDSTASESTPP